MSLQDEDLIEQRERQLPASRGISPGAQAAAARTALDATPLGPVRLGYDVRSVFDSRPVNAWDFNIPVTFAGEPSNPVTVSFTVPNGLVAVLRRVITFLEDPIPADVLRKDVLLTLLLNQGVVPNNESIPVGVEQDGLVNCFVVADQGSVLSARFVVSAAIIAQAPDFVAHFYGTFLQKTSIPPQFEIANPSNRSQGQPNIIAAPAAPALPSPSPSPSPTQSTFPRERGPQVPPFPVEWSYNVGQTPRVWYPVTSQGGRKRVLTTDEQFTYRDYLNATRPRG